MQRAKQERNPPMLPLSRVFDNPPAITTTRLSLAMKVPSLLVFAACVAGCTSSPLHYYAGHYHAPAFSDHSLSPVSEKQAWEIAKAAVARREHWPESKLGSDGLIHTVVYQAHRINDGGWMVIAHRAAFENRPEGACGYDGVAPAVIFINENGIVTRYTRKEVLVPTRMQGGELEWRST